MFAILRVHRIFFLQPPTTCPPPTCSTSSITAKMDPFIDQNTMDQRKSDLLRLKFGIVKRSNGKGLSMALRFGEANEVSQKDTATSPRHHVEQKKPSHL